MDQTQFKIDFYAAKSAYFSDAGGGNLDGYDTVSGSVWRDPDTGFQARLYTDSNGSYILSFAGTEDAQDSYQDVNGFGWGQWEAEICPFYCHIKSGPVFKKRKLGKNYEHNFD